MFQWFDCKDIVRKQELTDCINHNLAIGLDEVIIYNDSVDPIFHGQNIKNVSTHSRITYSDYINVVKDPSNYGSLVVLTNTDIKLDKDILSLDSLIKEKTLIALSRYEKKRNTCRLPMVHAGCMGNAFATNSQKRDSSMRYSIGAAGL